MDRANRARPADEGLMVGGAWQGDMQIALSVLQNANNSLILDLICFAVSVGLRETGDYRHICCLACPLHWRYMTQGVLPGGWEAL